MDGHGVGALHCGHQHLVGRQWLAYHEGEETGHPSAQFEQMMCASLTDGTHSMDLWGMHSPKPATVLCMTATSASPLLSQLMLDFSPCNLPALPPVLAGELQRVDQVQSTSLYRSASSPAQLEPIRCNSDGIALVEPHVEVPMASMQLQVNNQTITTTTKQSNSDGDSTSSQTSTGDCSLLTKARRNRAPAITHSILRAKYHLPISKAAKELGIGVTVMKKHCRRLGIARWPYRKLNSMNKLISSVKSSDPAESQSDTLTLLVEEKQRMVTDPSRHMRQQTKKLRQSSFKERYKMKHRPSPLDFDENYANNFAGISQHLMSEFT